VKAANGGESKKIDKVADSAANAVSGIVDTVESGMKLFPDPDEVSKPADGIVL